MSEFKKFTKRIDYIEAYQLTEDTWVKIKTDSWDDFGYHGGIVGGLIQSKGRKGDYVVKLTNGMQRIIRKADFEALYKPLEDDSNSNV